MGFVHLHTHTEYSFLDGACRIEALLDRAKALGQTALAITDHGDMCGVIEFYKAAKARGIKPLIGCEVYVAARDSNDRTHDRGNTTHHLVLLAKSMTGYKNLIKVVSKGFLDGFYYKPRVDYAVLKEHTEGLICLSACLAGEIPQAILQNEEARAEELIHRYSTLYGKENFFLELQDHGISEQKKVNSALISLAKKHGIGLVATNDVHYVEKKDAKYQDLLMCIQTNRKVDETDRMSFETDEFYLKSEEEMALLFGAVPQAMENTQKIADMCTLDFTFGVLKLPKFAVPHNGDSFAYLKSLCYAGLEQRYGKEAAKNQERLDFELNVIRSMGYVDYFLIVWDFIKYAKDNGIPVGPGRGSAAGSLVSYCLSITNIDPVRFGLIFERFLNPERVSMPDIDVDFCNDDRQKVIDYVVEKYGRDCVSQIITFNKMKAKNAIRDVGRVLDISYMETDAIAKMIPFDLKMTIEKALKMNPELKERYDTEPMVKELIDDAMALEGLVRNAGTHAAGVVISQQPLTEYVPLQKNDDVVITQFPKDTVEELGLLKMDFLGLRNLGIIKDAIALIEASTGEVIDIDNIDLNVKGVYQMISRGETEGVFQLESPGMKQFMKEMRPESIEDIVAGISLYRPGPMDQIPRYIKNKNTPGLVTYKHPLLEPILNVTYGCMVYQEQVMEIVRKLGGYSLARADLVRRAMSKKKMDVMNEERKNFIYGKTNPDGTIEIEGCLRKGVSEDVANSIFDEMMDFANYAFNKSHAAAYAFVVYQTAYLKYFYPAQYMAALLSSVLDAPEKVSVYSAEAARMGISILPPDINKSFAGFAVQEGNIRFGLAVIKNVGVGCIEAVVEERNKHGDFLSHRDFTKRTMGLNVSKRVHEYLIKAGAFDTLGEKRSCLLRDYQTLIDSLADDFKHTLSGQLSLWGEDDTALQGVSFTPTDIPEYTRRELLSLEKESVGFYLSGHPLNEFSREIKKTATLTFGELRQDVSEDGTEGSYSAKVRDGAKVTVCAVVTSMKTKVTKSNKIMAFVTAEDLTGTAELLVFPNVYIRARQYLVEDAPLVISGSLSLREDEEPKILVDTVYPLQRGGFYPTGGKLYLKLSLGKDWLLPRVKEILTQYPGEVPVCIHIEEQEKTALAPKSLWTNACDEALLALSSLLGKKNVVLR